MTHNTVIEALTDTLVSLSEAMAEAAASGNRVMADRIGRAVHATRDAMLIDTFDQGMHALEDGETQAAEELFRLAAEGGYVPAMCRLGFILSRKGKGEEARMWIGEAVEQGDSKASELLKAV